MVVINNTMRDPDFVTTKEKELLANYYYCLAWPADSRDITDPIDFFICKNSAINYYLCIDKTITYLISDHSDIEIMGIQP